MFVTALSACPLLSAVLSAAHKVISVARNVLGLFWSSRSAPAPLLFTTAMHMAPCLNRKSATAPVFFPDNSNAAAAWFLWLSVQQQEKCMNHARKLLVSFVGRRLKTLMYLHFKIHTAFALSYSSLVLKLHTTFVCDDSRC